MYGREKLVTYNSCELYNGKTDEFHSGEAFLKEEADKVMDAMEAKIKELEGKLEDVQNAMADKNTDLGMENHKLKGRIHELEVKLNDKEQCCKWCGNDSRIAGLHKRIAELESQLPKWISVKDRLPTEDGEYQVVYKHKNGAMVSTFDEWDNDYKGWCAAETSAVVYWAELLPPPPTTEESSAIEKEK